ncbi:MAG: ribonucleoside-diphosphate reductase subunit alpha, partial [Spirochaetales bacterium]|nr:ribonucleoside-diphosphate reductase subunit alpha [Spirochaetales bacterium]
MYIVKRDGTDQAYDSRKIRDAMEKAFLSVNEEPKESVLDNLTGEMEETIQRINKQEGPVTVEHIQDLVEKTLMERDFFSVAKSYILYRDKHGRRRADRNGLIAMIPGSAEGDDFSSLLHSIQETYTNEAYDLSLLLHKYNAFHKEDMDRNEALSLLVKAALELTVQEAPDWEFIASRLEYFRFSESLRPEMKSRRIRSFYDKMQWMIGEGLYGEYMGEHYSREEVDELESHLDPVRNHLLTYSALDLLLKRYVIHDRANKPVETPQELFMGIAMHLCMKEEKDRLAWVVKTYDIISRLQVTMATPTLSNARKPFHQLSSCFIDTVPDSLDGIYRSISSFAQVSKYGGGMGLYFGKVRAVGSPIRGFKGAAGGVIRWIKLANDTAVAVDQLGVRQGAVAVYLDIWHKDIPEFLQLKTNNGDDRMKAHDVFPALSVPDYFWQKVDEDLNGSWHLMCPHEVLAVKGYSLEDSWGEDWTEKYISCLEDDRIEKRVIPLKDLVRMIIKSAVETGTPFIFNRDHVNRMNPNGHKGMVYGSNLCTEIAQNMSPSRLISREAEDGDSQVVERIEPGDFVVCNLASLVLGNIDLDREGELEEIASVAVRALDNVIDLNFYPVPYAKLSNRHYRPIGLGISGYHHGLVKAGLTWESEAHLEWADSLFARINHAAIDASSRLAEEKGSYGEFQGSDWQTGAYFEKRGYAGE